MSISSSAIPQIELNAGVRIPQIGFGVFQVPATDTAEAALRARPGLGAFALGFLIGKWSAR